MNQHHENPVQTYARWGLAAIRIVNGALALFVPGFLIKQLHVNPKTQGPAKYVFRMFGIRTVMVGLDLLEADELKRARTLRAAPLIHASDVTAALIAGVFGQLPKRAAAKVALISTVNTILAIMAQPGAAGSLRVPPLNGNAHSRLSLWERLLVKVTQALDWRYGWHRLSVPAGLLELVGMRTQLRTENLYDTSPPPASPVPPPPDPQLLTTRAADGSYNDLTNPAMGSARRRFGRNVPLSETRPDPDATLLTPNPRDVSLQLLGRDTFVPATTLNLHAAAWLQFMIRGWFSHGENQKDNPWQLPLKDDDPWPDHPMKILRAATDPTRTAAEQDLPPTWINTETCWWDASQIYGSSKDFQSWVRSGSEGKLNIGPDGALPLHPDAKVQAALGPGWWLGLSLMQTLFTLEHNAICDRLKAEYPSWSDEQLFQHARLINAALLAKIHTVEWTPAILGHPTLQVGMRANWWGLETERLNRLVGRLSSSEVISGIPGSETDHFGVPYSLTEEFVAVYRMHPLVPDEFQFRAIENDMVQQQREFPDVAGLHAQEVLDQMPLADVVYSFGTSHPGAITLHNFPKHLQHFVRPDGVLIDLAATDILRARERGVPRYNRFRQFMHRPPVKTFADITPNPVWQDQLRQVYGDVDSVDVMVGLYAENPPAGFGFSDTAFRIFILMASRRLNSDRFFTTDYNERVYTPAGMEWINSNTFGSVALRHCPALGPALRGVDNAFAPWLRTSG